MGTGHLTGLAAVGRRSVVVDRAIAFDRIPTVIPPSRHLIAPGFEKWLMEWHGRLAGFAREDFVYG